MRYSSGLRSSTLTTLIQPFLRRAAVLLPAAASVALLVVVVAPHVGTAAPVFFTDRTAFESAAGSGLHFEGFEGPWTDSSGTAVFAEFTVRETNGTNTLFHATEAGGNSFSVTEGVDSVWYDDNGSSVGNFFNFDIPITAFGLDITYTQGNGLSTSTRVAIGGGASDSIALPGGTSTFWGMIDPHGISTVTFDASGNGFLGFDAVSYGVAVPEPSTSLLTALGLLAITRCRRRRASRRVSAARSVSLDA